MLRNNKTYFEDMGLSPTLRQALSSVFTFEWYMIYILIVSHFKCRKIKLFFYSWLNIFFIICLIVPFSNFSPSGFEVSCPSDRCKEVLYIIPNKKYVSGM